MRSVWLLDSSKWAWGLSWSWCKHNVPVPESPQCCHWMAKRVH